MAFFRRVIDHLLNQVLVEGLANSKWFQRFAVWSHRKFQNINETAKDPSAVVDSTLKAAQQQKLGWDKWWSEFNQEMAKIKGQGGQGPPSTGAPPGKT